MTQPQSGASHGSIIHIGAGDGAELEGYLASRFERIVLVEPEPDRAAAIEIRCANDPRTSVIAGALTGVDGEAELKTYNIRALDGLCHPTGLQDIYPGMRVLSRVIVPTLSPAALLKRIEPLPGPVRLVLHATGVEADILNAWPVGDANSQLDSIELRCSAARLFDGGSDLSALRALLQMKGFDEISSDLSDPDWPKLVLRQNALRLELDAQRTLCAQLEGRLAEADVALESASSAIATKNGRIELLEAQLLEAEAAQVAAGTALTENQAKQAELNGRIELLESQVSEAEAAREVALKNTREATEAAQVAAKTALTEHQAREVELNTARSDLAVTLRMQAMLQSDLRDLQARYAETLSVRQQQEDLLRKLTPRLQEAAQYIQDNSALQSEGRGQLGHAKPRKPQSRKPKKLPGAQG